MSKSNLHFVYITSHFQWICKDTEQRHLHSPISHFLKYTEKKYTSRARWWFQKMLVLFPAQPVIQIPAMILNPKSLHSLVTFENKAFSKLLRTEIEMTLLKESPPKTRCEHKFQIFWEQIKNFTNGDNFTKMCYIFCMQLCSC